MEYSKARRRKRLCPCFIGYDKKDQIRVAELLPRDICCWGVGRGKKGSYNYDPAYIQFEICEDGLTDRDYYHKAFAVAARYCAELCCTYGIPVENIVGHCEAYRLGYGSNHGDPEHWMKRFGETMDDFRTMVSGLLTDNGVPVTKSKPAAKGDLVSIAGNATYYGGGAIPAWVRQQNWYVKSEPTGDRVVVDVNESKTHSICSPIHMKFLTVVERANDKTGVNGSAGIIDGSCPYMVKITADCLNIYKGAGTDTAVTGTIEDHGVYSIVEERSGKDASLWGRLKSGAGWILLENVKKM